MNKESKELGRVLSRLSDATIRLGHVLYGIVFLLMTFVIIISLLEDTSIDSAGLSMLFAGLGSVAVLISLEIARRILLYVIEGKKFFSRSFPRISKICGIFAVLILAISLPAYLLIDLPTNARVRAAEDAAYKEAVSSLPAALAEAEECKREASEKPPYESPQCRQYKLNYAGCMESWGSHTNCLSFWDYETACKPSALNNLFNESAGCDVRVDTLTQRIQEYESKYGNP